MPTNKIQTCATYRRDSYPKESPWTCNGWDMAENNGAGAIFLRRERDDDGLEITETATVSRDSFEDEWTMDGPWKEEPDPDRLLEDLLEMRRLHAEDNLQGARPNASTT